MAEAAQYKPDLTNFALHPHHVLAPTDDPAIGHPASKTATGEWRPLLAPDCSLGPTNLVCQGLDGSGLHGGRTPVVGRALTVVSQ